MTRPEGNLQVLLIRVASGDEVSFSALVDRYWGKVYQHAMKYSKSPVSSQEITQDVFLKLWHQRATLTDIRDFEAYLFVLGRNQIISCIRRNLREQRRQVFNEQLQDQSDESSATGLERKELYEQVMRGIELLPPARKTVFVLSRFEGLSYAEIASRLQISRNTVKEHIVRSLAFLRSHVDLFSLIIVPGLLSLVSGFFF